MLEGDSEDSPSECSTGLFEADEEEADADMLSMDNLARSQAKRPQAQPVAADPTSSNTRGTHLSYGPSLSVVRSVSDSIEPEYADLRASPPVADPRPFTAAPIDWPPPMERPGIEYPDDWVDDAGATQVVIDPSRHWSGHSTSRFNAILVDAGAWLLGFVTMFITGLVTTGSVVLVLFALSLD